MKRMIICFLPLLIACQSEPVQIPGFEAYVWKRDRNGCAGERKVMVDTLIAQREKILKLSEQEVIRLLGQPDARELFVRNQKFLIYLLEENIRCSAPEDKQLTKKVNALHIRLNALGKANEIYINAF